MEYVNVGGLRVAQPLYNLIANEIAPGTGIDADSFWASLEGIVEDLEPRNRELLVIRDTLQSKIDTWYKEHPSQRMTQDDLREIGYLVDEGQPFKVSTQNVDPEIARIPGPQLVVPVTIERFATNATNARWGSLYNALYGYDIIPQEGTAVFHSDGTYNPERGKEVIQFGKSFLDSAVRLKERSHADVVKYTLKKVNNNDQLVVEFGDGVETELEDSSKFAGYGLNSANGELDAILLENNELHIEIQIDPNDPRTKDYDPAGVSDIVLESAVTTIQDLEDSVSVVDADDKTHAYRNWFRLIQGDLVSDFERTPGKTEHRKLNPDRKYISKTGEGTFELSGRSLLMARNVGIHMNTDAVTTEDGQSIPEGFLDGAVTTLAALHDLKQNGKYRNSKTGSIYIVKPKLHGPEEVSFTVELFARYEDAFGLERNTIKIGIMDEERRTTVNLFECIRAAKDRVVFINTGFLDRTGDEIHTNMHAGAMLAKEKIKQAGWLDAYEKWNVQIGLETGFPGVGQIGKGMWVRADDLGAMYIQKIGHPQTGANTAWVPSPSAATIHAMHYHSVDVKKIQNDITNKPRPNLDQILTPPLLEGDLTPEDIKRELENNVQGILGYVSRWVYQGIGCSKVPDINGTSLMEDRATLRISSQHIANWLHHGIVNSDQVKETFGRMAAIVDEQNAADIAQGVYRPMTANPDSHEFMAALELVFKGLELPNGYTEPVLHDRRIQVKRDTSA